jgi:type I restriction enzyme S subunit
MIDDLKPYSEYKDSGVLWLGKLPGHWDVVPSKALFQHRKDKARAEDRMLTASQSHGIISRHEFMAIEGRRVMQVVTGKEILKHVEPNDFVMSMRSFQGGLEWSRIGGAISSAYVMLIPRPAVHSPYYAQLLKCQPYIAALRRTSDLVRDGQALRYANFGQIQLPLPPSDEQLAIVRFLDHANGKIERAIRVKRKLIALLNEQKQAIIHRAVTRGIDPTVKLKPSGIPWLGDVPEHWKVERTKNVFRLRTEKSGLAHGKELLSIYTHIGVRPRKDLEQKGNKASTTDNYWIVKKGDLIINKLLAWMGAVGSSEYEGVTSPAYDILMPIRPLCSDFYHHLFRTKLYLQQFKQRSRGIMDMRLRLYFDQLGQIPVLLPPVNEQVAIVDFYVKATTCLTATISRTERQIALLREYRTTLTAEVVTGKFDVREAVKRLPSEAEEPLPIDDLPDEIDDEAPEGGDDVSE